MALVSVCSPSDFQRHIPLSIISTNVLNVVGSVIIWSCFPPKQVTWPGLCRNFARTSDIISDCSSVVGHAVAVIVSQTMPQNGTHAAANSIFHKQTVQESCYHLGILSNSGQ